MKADDLEKITLLLQERVDLETAIAHTTNDRMFVTVHSMQFDLSSLVIREAIRVELSSQLDKNTRLLANLGITVTK